MYEEPERFYIAEGNGLVTRQQYKEMVGISNKY